VPPIMGETENVVMQKHGLIPSESSGIKKRYKVTCQQKSQGEKWFLCNIGYGDLDRSPENVGGGVIEGIPEEEKKVP